MHGCLYKVEIVIQFPARVFCDNNFNIVYILNFQRKSRKSTESRKEERSMRKPAAQRREMLLNESMGIARQFEAGNSSYSRLKSPQIYVMKLLGRKVQIVHRS